MSSLGSGNNYTKNIYLKILWVKLRSFACSAVVIDVPLNDLFSLTDANYSECIYLLHLRLW